MNIESEKIFTNLKEMISTGPKFVSGKADFHYIWDPKTRHSQILLKKIRLVNGLVFECFMKTRSQTIPKPETMEQFSDDFWRLGQK